MRARNTSSAKAMSCTSVSMSDSFLEVALLADLPDEGFITRAAGDTSVVICRFEGEIYALENVCPHEFVCFDRGDMDGERLICPRHRAAFDVRTGIPFGKPAFGPLKTFPVKVEDDRVLVGV